MRQRTQKKLKKNSTNRDTKKISPKREEKNSNK